MFAKFTRLSKTYCFLSCIQVTAPSLQRSVIRQKSTREGCVNLISTRQDEGKGKVARVEKVKMEHVAKVEVDKGPSLEWIETADPFMTAHRAG